MSGSWWIDPSRNMPASVIEGSSVSPPARLNLPLQATAPAPHGTSVPVRDICHGFVAFGRKGTIPPLAFGDTAPSTAPRGHEAFSWISTLLATGWELILLPSGRVSAHSVLAARWPGKGGDRW